MYIKKFNTVIFIFLYKRCIAIHKFVICILLSRCTDVAQ